MEQPWTESHSSSGHEHWNLQSAPYQDGGQELVQLNPWDPTHSEKQNVEQFMLVLLLGFALCSYFIFSCLLWLFLFLKILQYIIEKKNEKSLYRCKVCYYFDQTMTRFILFIISTAAISGFTGFTEIYVYYINFTIFVKIAKIIQRFMHTNKSN